MTRRVRVKRETTIVSTSDRNKVKKLVDMVAGNILVIEEAQKENKKAMVELNVLMAELALPNFDTPKGKAEYITPATRASSTIMPEEFKAKVTEEEFMECVTIAKGKAKKVLSERELEEVSEKGKPVKKDPVLTVTPK